MYLSAERIALANQTVQETFEQTCIAWQAIPHWDTGDPGQTRVPKDDPNAAPPVFLPLVPKDEKFQLTLVQANAPTPDSLLTEVMANTGKLAKTVDDIVLQALYNGKASQSVLPAGGTIDDILEELIEARATVEDAAYRAPSCLFTNTKGLIALSELVGGYPVIDAVLSASNVNSLHRATTIDSGLAAGKKLFLMLGRRQRIAHGSAAEASPGEEPVDLAVSVLPSLEVIGEAANSTIEVAVRISFALRIKDANAIIAVVDP
jgi:hypothetical protein